MDETKVKYDNNLIKSFLKYTKPNMETSYDKPIPDLKIYKESEQTRQLKDFERYISDFEIILSSACQACIAAQSAPSKETKLCLDFLKGQVERGIEFFLPVESQVKFGKGYESGYDEYDQPYSSYSSYFYRRDFFHIDGTHYPEYVKLNFGKGHYTPDNKFVPNMSINNIVEHASEVWSLIERTQSALENASSKQRQ